MCRSRVAIPGSCRLRRQIGLQGGDKCQPKPIKIPQPLFWLSDLFPPSSTAVPERSLSVQRGDTWSRAGTSVSESRSWIWRRDLWSGAGTPNQSRDPKTSSSSPAPRLCSDDGQNRTSSCRPGSSSSEERASGSPKGRTSPSCQTAPGP